MGRHSKKSSYPVRKSSLIALTGLVPAGAGALAQAPSVATIAVHEAQAPAPAGNAVAPVEPAFNAAVAEPEPAPAPLAAPAPPPPAPTAAKPVMPKLPTSIKASPIGVPLVNLEAYHAAEEALAQSTPGCNMSWTLIAGIGRVESTHANDGRAEPNGQLTKPIYGPVLDGSLAGNHVIGDTDGGALDGNLTYDRAVGPMQFLPATWKRYGADGNGDGVADPQNLFDAALATGKYLCDGRLDMRDVSQQTKAILRYNNSMAYVANVMAWSVAYATGVVPTPEKLPRI